MVVPSTVWRPYLSPLNDQEVSTRKLLFVNDVPFIVSARVKDLAMSRSQLRSSAPTYVCILYVHMYACAYSVLGKLNPSGGFLAITRDCEDL